MINKLARDIRRERIASLVKIEGASDHLHLAESVMDLIDVFRKEGSGEGDTLIVQLMALRAFNSCAVAINLALEGYYQAGASMARDLLETGFLLELFAADTAEIGRWKNLSADEQNKAFSPARVRAMLEKAQGIENPQRAKRYKILSQIAAHPSAISDQMLRAEVGSLAVIGPFSSERLFKPVIEEVAYIAIVIGTAVARFMPSTPHGIAARMNFESTALSWAELYLTPLRLAEGGTLLGGD